MLVERKKIHLNPILGAVTESQMLYRTTLMAVGLMYQVPYPRKVDTRLHGKGTSNSHRARPVHLIIAMMKWIRTSRLSIKNSLSSLEVRADAVAKRHGCKGIPRS